MGPRSRSVAPTRLLLTLLTSALLLGSGEASAVQLTASWVDNSGGVATTRIERRLGTDPVFTEIADAPPGQTAYVDQTVSAGKTYCYRVFAWVVDGVSPYSDEVCATSSYDTATVTVTKAGTGAGTVASSPAGINCGTDCSGTYLAGTSITLAATPAAGSIFTGWSGGGCAGTAPCTFASNTSVTVKASFSVATSTPTSYTVNVAKTGNGVVTSSPSGINCGSSGSSCSATYSGGTTVTLTATPSNNFTFIGWRGGCSGSSRTCTVSATTSVAAYFRNLNW
jgi:hypothetical protein